MYSVIVLRRARRSLEKARRWYWRRNQRAAIDLVLCVNDTLEELARDPWISQEWDRTYRFRRVHRFPYVVYFEIAGGAVVIYAIIHERRKPGRWKPG